MCLCVCLQVPVYISKGKRSLLLNRLYVGYEHGRHDLRKKRFQHIFIRRRFSFTDTLKEAKEAKDKKITFFFLDGLSLFYNLLRFFLKKDKLRALKLSLVNSSRERNPVV